MQTRLRSKVTLLFVVCAALLTIPAVAALAQDTSTSTAAPTIQSDKDDYAPGELVTLTGSSWQPGESVHINVNDEEGQTWSRNVDVTADASGNIRDSFNLPDWFVATYKVTATGAESGVVTTTFTDSIVRLTTNLPSDDSATITVLRSLGNSNCIDGLPAIIPALNPITGGSTVPLIILGFPGTSQSLQLTAHPTSTKDRTFANWTVPGTTVPNESRTICVSGFTNSPSDVRTFTANYDDTAANSAPTTPGTITSDESRNNDGTFTLNWDHSTDVDGDNITYTLEKRATNDANWSELASGLTSPSYTFGGTNPAEGEGTWDYRVKAVDNYSPPASSDYRENLDLVKVDKSGPNAPTLSFATTDQSFKATVSGVDWYKDSAKIDVADEGDPPLADTSDGSGVDAASLQPNPFDVTENGASTASRTVKDNANNESTAGTLPVHVDAADPTLDNCPASGPFILNSGGGTQSVTINATDGESGVDNAASTLSVSVNTSTVGEKSVSFTAKDNVGHSDTKQCSYSVIFNFDGFRSPVDNPGTDVTPVFNSAKAGQSIPLKFGLGGNQGLSILQPATTLLLNPKVTSVNCDTSATVNPIEEYAASTANGGLNYDATADQYNYVWKTQSNYVNKCFKLDLRLTDGSSHLAYFKFLK